MVAISQTSVSNMFSERKMYEFRLQIHWILLLMFQLTIYQHWFRSSLGAVQATSHNLSQWWHSLLTHMCATRPQWVKLLFEMKQRHINIALSLFLVMFWNSHMTVCKHQISLILREMSCARIRTSHEFYISKRLTYSQNIWCSVIQ